MDLPYHQEHRTFVSCNFPTEVGASKPNGRIWIKLIYSKKNFIADEDVAMLISNKTQHSAPNNFPVGVLICRMSAKYI